MKRPIVINLNNLIGGLVIVSTEDHDSVKKQVEDAIDKALNRVKGLSYRVADMDVPESDRGKNSEPQLID